MIVLGVKTTLLELIAGFLLGMALTLIFMRMTHEKPAVYKEEPWTQER